MSHEFHTDDCGGCGLCVLSGAMFSYARNVGKSHLIGRINPCTRPGSTQEVAQAGMAQAAYA